MDFLKCIICEGSLRVYGMAANGFLKTKCKVCGCQSNGNFSQEKIEEKRKVEVIYK